MVCPTRARPQQAMEMAATVVNTSSADVLLYVDADDVHSKHLPELATDRIRIGIGKPIGRGPAINGLCEGFKEYEAYVLVSDDAQFVRKGWDEEVAKAIEGFQNRIGLVSIPDGLSKGQHVNWPCVSREWIDAVGWFNPPRLMHYCQDTAIQALGQAIDRVSWIWPQVLSHDCVAAENGGEKYKMDLDRFLWFMADDFEPALKRLRAVMT